MKLRLNNLFAAREWICLAGCLLAGAGVYLGLIQPSMALYAQHDLAEEEARSAEKEVADLRARYEEIQQQIGQRRARLQELGGSPPPAAEQDLQIARITALAKACGVSIDQYLPIGSVDEEDHRAAFLQFSARGDFFALQEFFRRVESQIDFVDITHFAMTSSQQEEGAACQLSWSCRINGMRPPAPVKVQHKDPRSGPKPAEAADNAPSRGGHPASPLSEAGAAAEPPVAEVVWHDP